jgi:HEAT repeat protein
LLTEKHDVPDAATFAERVFGLALTSDDAGVQINIISSLDAAKVRDRYGAAALKVLTTLANRDGNEDVRIAAIRILGQGGYSGAIESLRELAKSPSPAIAREAQSAIKKIGP